MSLNKNKMHIADLRSWAIFIIYILITGYTAIHHELWGDEIHSWNIAKASSGFFDLISNTRYEGHPPVWYIILWTISKFTHDPVSIQLVHFILACITVFILLFFSPLPFIIRALIPFGYFFIYEYSILSRNYVVGVLFAFLLCLIIHRSFKYKMHLYYVFLFLMANSHLVALLLAISMHFYFFLTATEKTTKKSILAFHILGGGIIFLSAFYFISPPADSELNAAFWASRWSTDQITAVGQLPLRSFIPVPAWWAEYFWNTEFLLDGKEKYPFFTFTNPLTLVVIVFALFIVLRKNKKSLLLFISNLLLSSIVTVAIMPLTTPRYSGFIFVAFLVSYWLYCYKIEPGKKNKLLIGILLVVQIFAGGFMVLKDIRHPFSQANKVNELLNKIPVAEKTVTDYWTLNTLSAFTNKTYYCIDMEKEMSFILWNRELADMLKKPGRYYNGINNYLKKEGLNELYLISTRSPQSLFKTDPLLPASFRVMLIDKREGAFEKGSNLYLYKVSPLL